ncbi:MFS transporter [Mycolicibacterium sp. S2-37]|uniref:MFS transporter n=1 Tax=Mycolicibacterium sp. S2-37 TaxID=2810297 RepID=UPI0027DA4F3C|nr:MFS transporter [Mycolicibacterium sp. S2-37]
MCPASPQVPPSASTAGRWRVLAWGLWDCGSTGINAVVVTFVFSVYLTGAVGSDLPGDTTPTSWLGRAMTVAGLLVAVLAPVTGVWVEAPRRRRAVLTLLTGATVLLTSAMSLIRDDHRYLWAGLILMAATAACSDLASVPYNAMLRQLSTPQNSGRISGFGWAMGYSGTVVLLLVVYLGFVAGDGDTRGVLGVPAADGQNVRAAMLLSAAWFLLFALPLLLTAPTPADDGQADRPVGVRSAYRKLWSDVVGEWRRDRNIIYYLLASAVFRDGLAGVFAFGAVLGVSVYGISASDVLLFGMSACVVAAVGAVAGGLLDDRIGSKRVIVGSLIAMIAVGITLLTLSGPAAFWTCGLLLCLFIGPTQSAARTLMLRMAADGKEGVAFGLYTTTGRAVSFLAPWLFFTFIDIFGTDRAGMAGLCVVLTAGLLAMLAVHAPHPGETASAGSDAVRQS